MLGNYNISSPEVTLILPTSSACALLYIFFSIQIGAVFPLGRDFGIPVLLSLMNRQIRQIITRRKVKMQTVFLFAW